MSTSRPEVTMITDESKFQERTINGKKIKFAQHEDDKTMLTVKGDDIGVVVRMKDGVTVDQAVEDCAKMFAEREEEMQLIKKMLMQNPQLASLLLGLGGPAANGPASPGTSRFGAFGGGFGGSPMNFSSDNSEEFRPSSPRFGN